jgi:predicted translin family RNA/ssDNA-binding protein
MAGGLATPTSSHVRSVTPSPNPTRSDSPTLMKAKSASHLSTMKTFSTPPRGRSNFDSDSDYLNTIPDPRTPSPNPQRTSPAEDSEDQHPDLSNEVAMLSTKLINAINYQTNLDDSLQHTRHELEAARQRIAQLEQETQNHNSLVSSGALVNKAEVDTLKQELTESQKQRDVAEKGRKEMEVELETLTSALFEEANTVSEELQSTFPTY